MNEGNVSPEAAVVAVRALAQAAEDQAIMRARIRDTSVADVLDRAARMYEELVRDENFPAQQKIGAEYLGMRCRAVADLLRNADAPERCVLDGHASAVDLLRAHRVLAAMGPDELQAAGAQLHASLGNQLSLALGQIAGLPPGRGADVEGSFGRLRDARASLTIWWEIAVRASQAATRPGGTNSGLILPDRHAQVRAQLLVSLTTQHMGELGALIKALPSDGDD